MDDAYFTLIEAGTAPASGATSETIQHYLAGPATRGPWSAAAQHGGPPTALAVDAAGAALAGAGRRDLVPLRVAADFVGPVPVGPIETRASVVRAARSAALVSVSVCSGERECLATRVWFVRTADTAAIAATDSAPVAPDDLTAVSPGISDTFAYGESIEWRWVHGAFREPGPGAVWARGRIPLVAGVPMSGLAQVALVADSASGVSSELDWTTWSFMNVDLDLHLVRPPTGEWIQLDAVTRLGAHGSAVARSTIRDEHGEIGYGLQTLVVASLPPQ